MKSIKKMSVDEVYNLLHNYFESQRLKVEKTRAFLKNCFLTWSEIDFKIYVIKCELKEVEPLFHNEVELAKELLKYVSYEEYIGLAEKSQEIK